MLFKMVSILLVVVLIQGSIAAQTQQQSPSQNVSKMQQVLRQAQDKDKAVNVTFNKKIDNQTKVGGKVSDISDTGFTVTDQKTGKAMKLAYQDVQRVKQKGLSKGWKIAFAVIAGVVVAAIVIGETITD